MCFGLTKIWRRKFKKTPVNTTEKSVPAASGNSPPTPAPVYRPPPSRSLDANTTAAATMDSTPVAKKEQPLTTPTPSKPTPSTTYLSAPKPSYSSRTKSPRSTSNSHPGGTSSSRSIAGAYGVGGYTYDSGGGGGGGGGGGSCGGGGGSCGGGGGGCGG